MRAPAWKADLVILATTAVWGVTFVTVKDSLSRADPFTFLTLRFGVGALGAAALAGRALHHGPSLRYGAILGVFLWLGYVFQTVGLQSTTPSRSAFITGMTVAVVPFVSLALFRKAPKAFSLAGVALASLGLYALTLHGAEPGASTLRGELLTLACAVGYAFHIVLTERFAPRAEVMGLVASSLAVVALLSALCLPFVETRLVIDGTLLVGVGVTGVLASTVAIGAMTWAQARTTAIRAALIYSLEPVFAALYSVLLGRERLGGKELLGGGLIVLGVLVAEVGGAWWGRGRGSSEP